MPAPPQPAEPLEIDLDSEDLIPEPEERSTSQTRRLGTNAKASAELEIKGDPGFASLPDGARVDEVRPAGGKPLGRPYLAGDVIDEKYRLARIIGRGGMGAVWQAHNIPLDIDVAIKLIRRDRTAPEAAERLLTEARAAARLMHPAIVRVFDFGETEQHDPFIVMELLHGESLSAILRRKRRLSPAVAVQTLLPVAAALASAHGKGIVHRDLKPDNIIVVTDESGALVPKIVDFGIAKLLLPELDRQVTTAGEVLGSPDYMSPEQARGADNVGEATDVWAFSVMLYELVTGKRPFDGANYNALIASILTDDPAPLTAHGVPEPALSGIVEHGLAKELPARWPRMRDMGAALASWAVANGIEDDLMGNSIRKQWLSGGARRLLTVQPETGEPRLHSGPVAPLSDPGVYQSAPWAPGAHENVPWSAEDPQVVAFIRERRASARRALLLVVGVVLLGAACVAAFLVRDRSAPLRAASSAPSPSADPSSALEPSKALPPAGLAPAPTGDSASSVATADPAASAAPSASGRVLGPLKLPKKSKAPVAPKNIRF
jgi:serine/threonine-protein kinase